MRREGGGGGRKEGGQKRGSGGSLRRKTLTYTFLLSLFPLFFINTPTGLAALSSLTGVRSVVSKSFVVLAAPPSWSTTTQRLSPPTMTNVIGTRYMDIPCMHDIIMTS